MSGNSLAHEAHLRMGTPVAHVVLGNTEPMNPPTMQRLHSAPSNVNIIQDSGKEGVASSSVMVSKTNEIEVSQPKDEVSVRTFECCEDILVLA